MLKSLTLATVAVLAIAPAAHAASLGMAQAEQALRKAGYTQIHEIEREDGLWEADVSRADGRFSEVYVDPKTGEIFDEHNGRALLPTEQVLAKAQSQGLREIHSLERDGATWSLEARNARNQKVEVRLSGYDGR
ncbi:PepSY domain-containing protein, partial [Stenotrophomonas maltophilia]